VGQEQRWRESERLTIATSWSPDGRFMISYEIDPKTKRDVWVRPLADDQKPFPFLQTAANDVGGWLSPDGRWMAYSSDATGAYEVYVLSFPDGKSKWQISTTGGIGPQWRRDGKELFYYAPDGKLMAVDAKGGTEFVAAVPHALFEFRSGNGLTFLAPYSVTAAGQRFLLNTIVDESGGEPLAMVVNWPMLKR